MKVGFVGLYVYNLKGVTGKQSNGLEFGRIWEIRIWEIKVIAFGIEK